MRHPPTRNTLQVLRRTGMGKARNEPLARPACTALRCEERLGLLVDRELIERGDRRLRTRWRQAK